MTRDPVTHAGTGTGTGTGAGAASAQASDGSTRRDRPIKRSLTIAGHRTSVSLEAAFWDALKDVAAQEKRTPTELVAEIDASRGTSGLSGAIRIYILEHFRARDA